nr:hypothetical protein [Deltaproteobacteria bacterium]
MRNRTTKRGSWVGALWVVASAACGTTVTPAGPVRFDAGLVGRFDAGVPLVDVLATDTTTVAPPLEQLALGFRHSCAVLADHTVRCWATTARVSSATGPP